MTRRDCLILLRAMGDILTDDAFTNADARVAASRMARAGADMLANDLEPTDQPRALTGTDLYVAIETALCNDAVICNHLTTEQIGTTARITQEILEERQRA